MSSKIEGISKETVEAVKAALKPYVHEGRNFIEGEALKNATNTAITALLASGEVELTRNPMKTYLHDCVYNAKEKLLASGEVVLRKDVEELVEKALGELLAIEIETDTHCTHGNRADDYKLNKWAKMGIEALSRFTTKPSEA